MLVAFTIASFAAAWAYIALGPTQTEQNRREIEKSDPWFNNED
jgi:hypothetical protein